VAPAIDPDVRGVARLSARPRGLPRGSARARSGGGSNWRRLTRHQCRDAAEPRRRARRARTAHMTGTDRRARAYQAAHTCRSHRADCRAVPAARTDCGGSVNLDGFPAAPGRASLDRLRAWDGGATGGAARQDRSHGEAPGAAAADARPRVRPDLPATAGHAAIPIGSNGRRNDCRVLLGRSSGLSGCLRGPVLSRRRPRRHRHPPKQCPGTSSVSRRCRS
jgi:hypothetical protein